MLITNILSFGILVPFYSTQKKKKKYTAQLMCIWYMVTLSFIAMIMLHIIFIAYTFKKNILSAADTNCYNQTNSIVINILNSH